jgi:hypothetical protein
MTQSEMSTLKTSGLLFLGGFLLMSLLAAIGTVGGGPDHDAVAASAEVESAR